MDESIEAPSGLDEMVGDALGSEPSTGDGQAALAQDTAPAAEPSQAQEPVQASTVAPTSPQLAQDGQTIENQAQPTPPARIRVGDREFSPEELQAALTTSQQFAHLQNKYVDALERMKQMQAQPVQQPQQAQPQVTPQAYLQSLRQKYDPLVKQYAEQGLIEQDFATIFPNMAAQAIAVNDRVSRAEQMVQQLAQEYSVRQAKEQSQGIVGSITRAIDMLANSGEAYAPLKDPAKVREYMQYLWELNPQLVHLQNPQFLARQYVAFDNERYLKAVETQKVTQARQQQQRLARADATTGSRPGGSAQPAQTPLDEMFDDYVNHSR